ncbi:hypothetical protein Tco_0302744 [Tanacetum coccineum]
MAYRASTSANPNPVISPTFIKANYEALESLLRDRHRAATLPLRIASPWIHKQGERTVGFEGAQSRRESRVERNTEGGRLSEEAIRGNGGQSVNLPPLLAAYLGRDENGQPFQSSLTSTYGGQPMYTFPNVPVYTNPNLTSAVLNPVGSVTPFVRWIEDYLLPNGLKMPVENHLTHLG